MVSFSGASHVVERKRDRDPETWFHVLNHCEEGLQLTTKRHNTTQDLLESLLVRQGDDVTVNKAIPGQPLRPDVESQLSGSQMKVDVVFSFDQPGSMECSVSVSACTAENE